MARGSLDPGAPGLAIVLQGGTLRTIKRLVSGAATQSQPGPAYPQSPDAPDVWLRLERTGKDFIASTSNDGLIWVELDRASPQMGPTVEVGIAATDHEVPAGRNLSHGIVCSLELVSLGPPPGAFHRGDPNLSGTIDLSDSITIFGYLFLGNPTSLSCIEAADAGNDGQIDISDGVYILSWLFTGGPQPAPPGPTTSPCGFDPDPPGSAGDLGCETYDACQ